MTRVSGHELRYEGAAFEPGLDLDLDRRYPFRVHWNSVRGRGFGLCSCGAQSPVVDSGYARKAWHRAHKAEMAADS